MKFSGYIEGYYGKVLSFDERKRIILQLQQLNMNTYLFASKDDIYHRVNWKEIPPRYYLDELTKLIHFASKNNVTFIPAIAPGLTFDYSDSDKELLWARIKNFRDCGATTVALLMDDIPLELPTTIHSDSLGKLHGELLNSIKDKFPTIELLFCPTLYTDELIDSGSQGEHYLSDLKSVAPNTTLFWTGNATISETIDSASCKTITDYFKDVIIWDNYYANDYMPSRLFVGDFIGRDREFVESISGIMINPTGMIETDLFLLELMSNWQKAIGSWNKTAQKYGIPQAFTTYLPWFSSPFHNPPLSSVPDETLHAEQFFNTIIVEWQSPLKLEWYSALHRFFVELRLQSGKFSNNKEWLNQRFLPYTAHHLYKE